MSHLGPPHTRVCSEAVRERDHLLCMVLDVNQIYCGYKPTCPPLRLSAFTACRETGTWSSVCPWMASVWITFPSQPSFMTILLQVHVGLREERVSDRPKGDLGTAGEIYLWRN